MWVGAARCTILIRGARPASLQLVRTHSFLNDVRQATIASFIGHTIAHYGSSQFLYQKAMAILQTATQPVKDRPTCFLENDDLGILGCASTSLYKVVSIALTLWAIWDPYVPGGGQMVGSPLVLDRFFQANTSEYQVVSITRSSSEQAVSTC